MENLCCVGDSSQAHYGSYTVHRSQLELSQSLHISPITSSHASANTPSSPQHTHKSFNFTSSSLFLSPLASTSSNLHNSLPPSSFAPAAARRVLSAPTLLMSNLNNHIRASPAPQMLSGPQEGQIGPALFHPGGPLIRHPNLQPYPTPYALKMFLPPHCKEPHEEMRFGR